MERWSRAGRPLFTLAVAILGAEHLLIVDFVPGLEQVPATIPLRTAVALIYGSLLLVAGIAVLVGVGRRWGAILLMGAFSLFWLVVQVPPLLQAPAMGSLWTRAFESLAIASAAATLAAAQWDGAGARRLRSAARVAFGVSLLVFGALHFIYLAFTATLVPAWIPGRTFWAGFAGAAFLAAGSALVTGIKGRLAATWTGIMFAGFVLLLHLPLVAASVRNPGQWSSALVALLMWGGAWSVAEGIPS